MTHREGLSTVNQLKHRRVLWSRRSGLNGRPPVYETETEGLLKSLMTWAIPLSLAAIRSLSHSVLFVSLCRTSRQFVALANTLLTPKNGLLPPYPQKIRPQAVRGEASV